MSDEIWEELSDFARKQNTRITALEKFCQAILASLDQTKRELAELKKRLEADEQSAAWYQKEGEK